MPLYFKNLPVLLAPALLMAAGCGGMGTANSSNAGLFGHARRELH